MVVGYARAGTPVPPELTPDGYLPTGDLVEVASDGSIRVMGVGRNRSSFAVDATSISTRWSRRSRLCIPWCRSAWFRYRTAAGERAAALVVTGGEELGLEDVTAQLANSDFPKSKWPEFVFTVADLPQNRVGQLSRPDATALARQLAATTDSNSHRKM